MSVHSDFRISHKGGRGLARSRRRRMRCGVLLVLAIGMSTQPPTPAPPPAPSPDPTRWAANEQPAPVQTNHPRPSRRWKTTAHIGQWRTGNAAGVLDKWFSDPIFGSSPDEVVMAQQRFINDHLHPAKRQKKAKAPAAASSSSAAASSSNQLTTAAAEPRARRSAAPGSLAESKGPQVAIQPRAGPGELPCAQTSLGSFSGVPGPFPLGFWHASRAPRRARRAPCEDPDSLLYTERERDSIAISCARRPWTYIRIYAAA
jgi:hypothetical protein